MNVLIMLIAIYVPVARPVILAWALYSFTMEISCYFKVSQDAKEYKFTNKFKKANIIAMLILAALLIYTLYAFDISIKAFETIFIALCAVIVFCSVFMKSRVSEYGFSIGGVGSCSWDGVEEIIVYRDCVCIHWKNKYVPFKLCGKTKLHLSPDDSKNLTEALTEGIKKNSILMIDLS